MLRSRILVSSIGLMLAGAPAIGCELCAIYAGSHGLDGQKNGWFTGAAEQFTSFGGLQLDGKDYPNVANQSIETSTTQFLLGYNFNDHFSLQANIPYIHRSYLRPTGALMENGSVSGLGDTLLVGKLLLLHREKENRSFTWSLLAGLKFPTGSTTQLLDETQRLDALLNASGSTKGHTHGSDSAESAIHGFDLTLGSGSLDGRLGTSFHYEHGRFFFGGAAQYAINTEGDYGYRFANSLTWDGGPGYYLMRDATRTLALEAAFSGEHKGSDTYKDQPVDDTGFTAVYIGPKLTYSWKDRLAAHLGVDFPVSVTNSGLQTVPGPRLRAGFTWTFGGTSEPPAAADGKKQVKSLALDGSAPPIWLPAPDTRFYASAEYLMWWVKDAPLSIPLVSAGPIATTHHGLLGDPAKNGADSTILYGSPHYPAQGGNDTQRFQNFSGTRFTFGYTLGAERRFALEASAFALQQQSAGYASRGDDTGHPVMGIPVYNSVDYRIGGMRIFTGEDSLPFSLAEDALRARSNGLITGGISVVNDLDLWGGELNGVISLYRTPSWEISGIVGFRYLELSESLNITSVIEGLSQAYYGQFGVVRDGFSTKNRFYGGTLGLRGSYSTGRLSLDMSARVALGTVEQIQNIAGGYFSYNFKGAYDAGTQGVFAQTSNEGRVSANRFAAVPEAQIKIGYAITPRLRATVGYDFLYFSSVMRPGDNMNREVPKGQTFNQADPIVSTTSPSRLTRTTDFFAHGVSVGMEYRF
jgi:hypothetical protein